MEAEVKQTKDLIKEDACPENGQRRLGAISAVVALLWLMLWTALALWLRYDGTGQGILALPAGIAVAVVVVAALLYYRNRKGTGAVYFSALSDRALFFLAWAAGFLLFLLTYLAFFPGILGYDSPVQLAMFFGDIELNAANPLMHTLILGSIVWLGSKIFGSFQAGFALFVLLQGILLSAAEAGVLVELRQRRAHFVAVLIGFAYVFVNPFVCILSVNSTKDIVFGSCLLGFLTELLRRERESASAEKDTALGSIRFLFFGIFSCLNRNAAVWLFAAAAVLWFLTGHRKKREWRDWGILFSVVFLFQWISGAFFQIEGAPMSETISLPIQQLAGVIHYAHDPEATVNISEEELAAAERLFESGEAVCEAYTPLTVDPVKELFDNEEIGRNMSFYTSLYFRLGLKNKGLYFYTWRDMVTPYFDQARNPNRFLVTEYTFSVLSLDKKLGIHEPETRNGLRCFMEELLTKEYEGRAPFLLEPIVMLLMLGILGARLIALKEGGKAAVFLPYYIYLVAALVAPVALLRYMYPLMVGMPLILGTVFSRE